MKRRSKFKTLLKRIIASLLILSVLWVVVDKFKPVWVTPLMLRRTVANISDGKKVRNDKTWVPISKISNHMVMAVLASEDNLFMEHHGFSTDAIRKAIQYNKKGKRLRGGSTISQQTAKNVFTFGYRNYFRKGVEAYYTALIELIWGKKRIMEVYLNVVELGNGIYGVEAASMHYFHCHASQLSASQAALLAASLPNPRVYSVAHPGPYMLRRQSHIVNLMPKLEPVSFRKK